MDKISIAQFCHNIAPERPIKNSREEYNWQMINEIHEEFSIVLDTSAMLRIWHSNIISLRHVFNRMIGKSRCLVRIIAPVNRDPEHCPDCHLAWPQHGIRYVIIRQTSQALVYAADFHLKLYFTIFALFPQGIAAHIVEPDADWNMIDFFILPCSTYRLFTTLNFIMIYI